MGSRPIEEAAPASRYAVNAVPVNTPTMTTNSTIANAWQRSTHSLSSRDRKSYRGFMVIPPTVTPTCSAGVILVLDKMHVLKELLRISETQLSRRV
jgi:hypothetical protein